jgi:hypothetical protein
MYLLLEKTVQAILSEYLPEKRCFALMLRNFGTKDSMHVAWTWITVVFMGILNYSIAPVSARNKFQDLPHVRETAGNTERYIQ